MSPLPVAVIRVLVVSRDQLSRAGLAALLDEQPGITVVGQVAGSEETTQLLDVYAPDVLIWDVAWETPQAVDDLGSLTEESPPVLSLAANEGQGASAKAAGARGLISRDASAGAIAAALQAVVHGLRVEDPAVSGPAPAESAAASSPLLTPREFEVLRLLAEGLPNKGLAVRLAVSEHTVKFHVNAIMVKLNAQSRTEAVTRATRLGILPL